MTDIISPRVRGDDDIIALIELLFFAYRDFVGDADHVLETFGFGRAHHRVVHFVCRYPGLTVADLLDVLRITKQSLSRVLKQLLDEGYIVQKAGDSDRRQRLLFATAKGEALVEKLARLQTDRIQHALADLGPGGAEAVGMHAVLLDRGAGAGDAQDNQCEQGEKGERSRQSLPVALGGHGKLIIDI